MPAALMVDVNRVVPMDQLVERLWGREGATLRSRLAQERLATQYDLIDSRLRPGRGGRLVAEPAEQADAYALDERVQARYTPALRQPGRTAAYWSTAGESAPDSSKIWAPIPEMRRNAILSL